LLGKSDLSALEARHIAFTLHWGHNECQREKPSVKNKILAFRQMDV